MRKAGRLKGIQRQNSGCIGNRKCHGCKARYDCYRLSDNVNIACYKCKHMYSECEDYRSCKSFFKSELKCKFKYWK